MRVSWLVGLAWIANGVVGDAAALDGANSPGATWAGRDRCWENNQVGSLSLKS